MLNNDYTGNIKIQSPDSHVQYCQITRFSRAILPTVIYSCRKQQWHIFWFFLPSEVVGNYYKLMTHFIF